MIDISHKQAQRWIRDSLDRRLPDGQWAALQAHVETCAECRAYMVQMSALERKTRRALKGTWSGVSGPAFSLTEQVLAHRQMRMRRRRKAVIVFAGMAALLVFYLLGGFNRLGRLGAKPAPVPVSDVPSLPTSTQLPTPQPGEFRGIVAFDAMTADGVSALFLLNPASEPDASPEQLSFGGVPDTGAGEPGALYNDSDPAWAPDGEWLAFLSDRASANGKKELFVVNVAGSRLVQLTASPDIDWEAPLSWSADGQWIALSGVRTSQGNQRWVYRVPVNAAAESGPVAVAGSRNGYAPEFAPYDDRLAYSISDGTKSGMVIDHIQTGEKVSASWPENARVEPPAPGAAFDWSLDGTGLVYISGQPPEVAESNVGSQVVAVRDLNNSINLFYDFLHNFLVAQSRWPGAFRAVTWTPRGSVVYLEDLDDARANDQPGQTTNGCWSLQFRRLGFRGSDDERLSLSGLCVEGGLDRSSWTADGHWLVVLGRTVEEMVAGAPRGIYAVYVPHLGESELTRIIRLGSVNSAAGSPRVRPVLRRYKTPPVIDPQPVNGAKTSAETGSESGQPAKGMMSWLLGPQGSSGPADASRAAQPSDLSRATGQVYFARPQGNGSVIARMNPDGTGGRLVFASDGANTCPSPSPDGSWVAFVSDVGKGGSVQTPGGSEPVAFSTSTISNRKDSPRFEVYIVDTNGGRLAQVSSLESLLASGPASRPDGSSAAYGCPVWSPDGAALAVVIKISDERYLGVLPVKDGKPDPDRSRRYLPISRLTGELTPQWVRRGENLYILLPVSYSPSSRTHLLAVRVPEDPPLDLTAVMQVDEPEWKEFAGLSTSPGGADLGWLVVNAGADGQSYLSLGMEGPNADSLTSPVTIGIKAPGRQAGYNQLNWFAPSQLGVVLQAGSGSRVKATINLFDIAAQSLSPVVEVEDTLYGAAWSPDGRWLIYASESGLWGVDVRGALSGTAKPVWLSPQPVEHLSWR